MNARKCDVCGMLYENYNKSNNKDKPNSLALLNTDEKNRYYSHDRIDLCPSCMEKIMQILRGNKK